MPLRYPSDIIVETYRLIGDLDCTHLTADQYRTIFRAPEGSAASVLPVRTEDRFIDGIGGPLRLRFYTPSGAGPFPILLYCHGGGFMNGSPESTDGICGAIADQAGCIVISPDYRLAPETPFPGGVEDCWRALLWARDQAGSFGGDNTHLAVAGDSSGGNFAAVLALRAAVAGLPLRQQLLLYPALDPGCDTPSFTAYATGYFPLTAELTRWFWRLYLPPDTVIDSKVSPLYATSLAGVAPVYIMTAEYDVLRDEAEFYARQLQQAGVSTTLRRWDGHVHGFLLMQGQAAEADAAIAEAAAALAAAFGTG